MPPASRGPAGPAAPERAASRAMDPGPHPRRRALGFLAIVLIGLLIVTLGPINEALHKLLEAAQPVMTAHPVLGPILFALLSALSAMLAFVSSAAIVPVAVFAWGRWATAALLWGAWIGGGACAWLVGKTLGRRVAARFIPSERLDYYASRLDRGTGFATVLLFQLAVPSEVPGYVLGTVGYPFWRYLLALALAELPFAVGAVTLGHGLVEGQRGWLIAVGLAGAALSIVALTSLRRRMDRRGEAEG